MPHAIGIVTVGEEPGIVPDNMIYAIRKRVEEIAAAGGELFDSLQPGDEITISDGPFAGYEAIFDTRIEGQERVRVLLQFLNDRRQVTVELDARQIKKKK
jgi:transcriptional antiterminator RfaH